MDTILVENVGDERIYRCPADNLQLYTTSGSSYFWNTLANGQLPQRIYILTTDIPDTQAPLMCDKEGWHKEVDDRVNILYADGHVTSGLRDFGGL